MPGRHRARSRRCVTAVMASSSPQHRSRLHPGISRVQQSMIALQINPTVGGGPHLGHVHMPQRLWTGDPEKPRTAPPISTRVALQQPILTHDRLHPFGTPISREANAAIIRGGHHSGEPWQPPRWPHPQDDPSPGPRPLAAARIACREMPATRARTAAVPPGGNDRADFREPGASRPVPREFPRRPLTQ